MRRFFIIECSNAGCEPTYQIKEVFKTYRILNYIFDIVKDCFMPAAYRRSLHHRYIAVCDKDLNPIICLVFDFNLICNKDNKDEKILDTD